MKYFQNLSILSVFYFFCFFNLANAQNLWEPTGGISGGSVSTITGVTNNIFIAGYAGGGLYRSTDGGENWYSISNNIANLNVFILKTNSSGDVYAGTTQSIYKSTDLGINWEKVNNSFPQNGYAEDITFDASDNIYVANNYGGVYKSTDGGNSWNQVNNGLPQSRYIQRVGFTSNNILLAADMYRGIYKSTDFGANWVQSNSGFDTTFSISNFNSNNSGEIFISTFGNGPFKSTDNGDSWFSIKGDLTLPYTADIDFTSNGDLFVTIVQQIYKSTNNGINWNNVTTMFNGLGFQSAFVDNNDNVWVNSLSSGVIKSTDGGVSWINYTNGLSSTLINSLVADVSGNLFAAVGGKGLYSSTDNGQSWNKILIVNNEEDTFIRTVEVLPSGGLIVYNVYNGIYITTDLSTWNPFNTGLTNQAIRELAVSNDYFFAAGWDGKFFRTQRGAANWEEITDTSVSGYCYDLFVSSAGELFYLFDQEIYKSTDNGDSWIDVGAGISGYSFSITQNSFADLFVGTNQGVYRSTDAGTTWIKDISGLTDGALSLTVYGNNTIFAGGYGSVLRSNDFGQTWSPFTNGILNCRITDLVVGKSDILLAAAENMGVYRTTSAVTSVDDENNGTINNFTLGQNYPNPFNPNTRITFKLTAPDFISLKVYDILGNQVADLINENRLAGNYSIDFNAFNLSSGVYFYRLKAGLFVETKKMILLK